MHEIHFSHKMCNIFFYIYWKMNKRVISLSLIDAIIFREKYFSIIFSISNCNIHKIGNVDSCGRKKKFMNMSKLCISKVHVCCISRYIRVEYTIFRMLECGVRTHAVMVNKHSHWKINIIRNVRAISFRTQCLHHPCICNVYI